MEMPASTGVSGSNGLATRGQATASAHDEAATSNGLPRPPPPVRRPGKPWPSCSAAGTNQAPPKRWSPGARWNCGENPLPPPRPPAGPARAQQQAAIGADHDGGRAARLDQLQARANEAAARIEAERAELDASNEYTARIEREAQAEPEADRQAEAPAEIEMELQ